MRFETPISQVALVSLLASAAVAVPRNVPVKAVEADLVERAPSAALLVAPTTRVGGALIVLPEFLATSSSFSKSSSKTIIFIFKLGQKDFFILIGQDYFVCEEVVKQQQQRQEV
ncbi:hypothetical protein KCU63_g17454, partial [Aureobasidium melanogenum]